MFIELNHIINQKHLQNYLLIYKETYLEVAIEEY